MRPLSTRLSPLLVYWIILCANILISVLDSSHLLPSNSHCTGAFDSDEDGEFTAVFNFEPLQLQGASSLQAINVGFGTTGSLTIFESEKKRFSDCCHGLDCQPATRHNIGVELTNIVRECVKYRHQRQECETAYFMKKARQLIIEIATSGIQSIADYPVPFIYRELLDLVPTLEVIHTLREPRIWVMKRLFERYNADFICDVHKPEIMAYNKSRLSSPFHILECMRGSRYIYDNVLLLGDFMHISHREAMQFSMGVQLTREHELAVEEVARYFAAFNRIVANTVSASARANVKYTPVCVWDRK